MKQCDGEYKKKLLKNTTTLTCIVLRKVDSGTSSSNIPVDITAMIVIGAIVCIGLTSVAALMILHVRSLLLKATVVSIYNQEKAERQFAEKDSSSGKALDVTIGTIPRSH